jgi:hypothetical protein
MFFIFPEEKLNKCFKQHIGFMREAGTANAMKFVLFLCGME